MLRFAKILLIICLFIPLQILAKPNLIVSKDGSGDFTSVQAALDAVPNNNDEAFIIHVKNGIYEEKLFIEKSNIAIIGENKDSTIIVFAELRRNWKANHPDDYGSAVVNIKRDITDIVFCLLTIHNNYGSLYGDNDHQFAIRSFEGTTRIIIYDCKIIADGGDTVSLWNTDDGMYYHSNCYFEGYVDYVCPRGYCFIEDSKFYGRNLTASIWHDGSHNEDQKFVIVNSQFDGVEDFSLGRFHRDAQFFLINCIFSKNMADKQIFFAPSKPPRVLQWGENRNYFHNCFRNGSEFSWYQNNLEQSKAQPKPREITALWVFNNKWNPNLQLDEIWKKFLDSCVN